MRCRFAISAPTAGTLDVAGSGVATVAVVVVVVAIAVVVVGASRSFLRNRNRDGSSTSTGAAIAVTVVVDVDVDAFFGLAIEGLAAFAITARFISFVSITFASFVDVSTEVDGDGNGVVTIIVGFSVIVGTICSELPNFTLFSANGLVNVLNERNSLVSLFVSFVQAGNMRRLEFNGLVNMFVLLLLLLALFVTHSGASILIWNDDVNVLLVQSN